MDAASWGFSRWPFLRDLTGTTPDVGQSYEEALARLLYLVDDRRRCGVLSGEAGIGKSRLFRRVRSYSQRRGAFTAEIDATGLDGATLTVHIAEQLVGDPGHGSVAECWSRIQEHLTGCAVVNQPGVLLVEQFELADPAGARVLRRLINLADSVRSELTVLISTRVAHAAECLSDCVDLTIPVTAWSLDETAQFVAASLAAVGSGNLWTPDALQCLHEITEGVPGEVIRVCNLSLLAAVNEGLRDIDASLVSAAAVEADPVRRSSMPAPVYVDS